jgi:hypothetical protein
MGSIKRVINSSGNEEWRLDDDCILAFGDDQDAKIKWDGTELLITGAIGALSLGKTLTVAGIATFNGVGIHNAAEYYAAGINVSGVGIFNSGLSSAGETNLQTVIVGSSLAIAAGGTLSIPQKTSATQLPSADPGVAGELWVDTVTIKRSTGT